MSRRKAEMVLELIDRATGPARRFIALQRRMGKAVEAANRMSGRSSRTAQRATDLYKRAVQGLDRAQDALQRGIRRSNDLIRRQIAQMRHATGMMRGGIMGTGRAALLAGGMFAAYAGTVSAAGLAMLGPARQFEKFQTVLTTTEGSAAAAQEAMGWVQDFAVKTPYELDQVMEAFVKLRAYGLDPTNGLLQTLGNTSAAMGKDINQAVEAVADAVTGENERLKEFGVKAAKVGDYFEYTYSVDGVEKKVRALADDRAAIEAALTGIFDDRFSGAMELQAKTFDGMLSNIMDQWAKFQLMIMSNGVFDWMKSKMKLVLDELDRLSASGDLELWAKRIADHILTGLNAIWEFGAAAVRFWKALYPWLQSAADALGGWRNLALAVLAIPFRGVILGAAFSLLQFAGGAALAVKALAGIGFGSATAGALRLGSVMLGLLNPLNLIRGAFIALRVALISTGIGALVVGLATAGLWIYNNWSGLKAFFKGFGEAFMKSLGPARPLAEGVIRVVRRLLDWIGRLTRPLEASAGQWTEWGRAAGRAVGDAVTTVRRFVSRITGWFSRLFSFDWGSLFSIDGLKRAWAALWQAINPVNWSDYIGEINWLALSGGAFLLSRLLRPIVWTAKLIGAPVKWALLGGKFALSGLLKPVQWTAQLISKIPWLILTGGKFLLSTLIKPISWTTRLIGGAVNWALLGGKFALSSLLIPIQWVKSLISKVPWLSLAGGGKKFALTGLLTALKWTTRLIPGIGWAVLAGELAWHLLIKKIDWSAFSWLKFNWKDILPDWDWSDIIPDAPDLGGYFSSDIGDKLWWAAQGRGSVWGTWEDGKKIIGDLQAKIITTSEAMALLEAEASGGEWAGRAEKMLNMLREAEGIQPPQISDPETLLQAARAAEQLQKQFPKINAAATETLNALTVTFNAMQRLVAGMDYTGEGARLIQSLADGMRSKMAEVTAAATAITQAVRSALPDPAKLNIGIQGGAAPVQERAGGGAFGPGWLLTGEKGPELEYRTKGGFIAHHQALQNMVDMSQTVARNSANANRTPGWLKGAALASGIAASTAVPAAASAFMSEEATESRVQLGTRYLTGQSAAAPGPVSVSAPITLNIQGNVDQSTMPELNAALEEVEERIMARLENKARATRRTEHS